MLGVRMVVLALTRWTEREHACLASTRGVTPAWQPFCMAFTINYARGTDGGRDYYENDETYAIKDFGVLEVTKGGELVKVYSPNYWTSIVPGERKKTAAPRASRIY